MGDGFLEGLDNFSETKVIGVVFIGGGSFGGG